jgi:hypothetical protein
MFRGVAWRPSDQIICKDKLCPADGVERQFRLARFGGKTNVATRRSEQTAAKTLASVDRPREFDLGFETGETIIVFGPNQGTVDARGADLEHIGAGNRVCDIKQGGHRAADLCAVIDRHRLVIEPHGHHLKRRPPTAGDDDPDEAITHGFERRSDRLRDAVRVDQESTSPLFVIRWICVCR